MQRPGKDPIVTSALVETKLQECHTEGDLTHNHRSANHPPKASSGCKYGLGYSRLQDMVASV
jgi:hypothetical protein